MSDTWDRLLTGHPEAPKEFLISVELYVSNTAGAALRKVGAADLFTRTHSHHFVAPHSQA